MEGSGGNILVFDMKGSFTTRNSQLCHTNVHFQESLIYLLLNFITGKKALDATLI